MCGCSGVSPHTGVMKDKGVSPREPFHESFSPGQLPQLPQQTSGQRSSPLALPGLNPCSDASWIRKDLSCSQACPEAQAKPLGVPGRGSSAKDMLNWP